MEWVQNFHSKKNFDKTFNDIKISGWSYLDKKLLAWYSPYIAFIYAVRKFDIFHHHFYGGFLGKTWLWKIEAPLLHSLGKKIIITAVGGDFYRFDKIIDMGLHHGYLCNYPQKVHEGPLIQKKIDYWVKHADIIMNGFQVDAIARWDIFPFSMVTINTNRFSPERNYNNHDGQNGVVKIMHTPNHRSIKGTEYIQDAVEKLNAEGLKVQLFLIEKMQNDEVLQLMERECDILAEQLTGAYALSAIEGMACGVPVIGNFENGYDQRPFRRFSYLNECPIVSATHESVVDVLRVLVTRPELRKELGIASRRYAEKYHSNEAAQFIYTSIYQKIWQGSDIDLMSLFHPLNKESYNNRKPIVKHPLKENKLPEHFFS